MKKEELIHVHQLLSEIKNHVEREGWIREDVDEIVYDNLPAEAKKKFEQEDSVYENSTYKELGVKPTSIHKGKEKHKEGVKILTYMIAQLLDDEEVPTHEKRKIKNKYKNITLRNYEDTKVSSDD